MLPHLVSETHDHLDRKLCLSKYFS